LAATWNQAKPEILAAKLPTNKARARDRGYKFIPPVQQLCADEDLEHLRRSNPE